MVELHCEHLGLGKQPKKRKRFVQECELDFVALEHLPQDWQVLLVKCLKLGPQSRWSTWQKLAGLSHKSLLDQLYDWLLRNGCIVGYENFKTGVWWPYKIEWQHERGLRKAFGLPIAGEQQLALQSLLSEVADFEYAAHPAIAEKLAALLEQPYALALNRAQLLKSLCQWMTEQRTGTYRDFALFARGATKALNQSEWAWLSANVDLSEFGVQSHSPLLYFSAGFQLQTSAGCLDISQAKPYIALPVAVFDQIVTILPVRTIERWLCVENLTSFERLAQCRLDDTAILWLPGFAPSWWTGLVSKLILLCPAPLQVACDPDPAGIRIAQQAISLWQKHGLAGTPWRMGINELDGCKHKKATTDHDQRQMQLLLQEPEKLHPELLLLVQYMQEKQVKAEQESYL